MSGMSPDFMAALQQMLGHRTPPAAPTMAGSIPGFQSPQQSGSPYFDAQGRLISGPNSAAKPGSGGGIMDMLMQPHSGGVGGAASLNPFYRQPSGGATSGSGGGTGDAAMGAMKMMAGK